MTPEQEVARKKRAVAAARSVLSLESGLLHGAKRIAGALSLLGHEVPSAFPVFSRFLKAVPAETPTGDLRLLCQEKLLFESDQALAAIEAEFRVALLRGCLAVIRAYT